MTQTVQSQPYAPPPTDAAHRIAALYENELHKNDAAILAYRQALSFDESNSTI